MHEPGRQLLRTGDTAWEGLAFKPRQYEEEGQAGEEAFSAGGLQPNEAGMCTCLFEA